MTQINIQTRKEYKAGNQDILQSQAETKKYTSTLWGTYLQFKEKGMVISKGEKGTFIKIVADSKKEKTKKKQNIKNKVVFKKAVFNFEQTDT